MAASSFLDDSSSLTGSALTASTSSTVWGPGALTGKFLKAVGELSLDLMVNLVIRRRLLVIKQTLEKNPHVLRDPRTANDWQQMKMMHTNLKELCRECYALSFRRAAAKLIRDITLITRCILHPLFIDASPTNKQWEALLARVHRRDGLLSEPPEMALDIDDTAPSNGDRELMQASSSTTMWRRGELAGNFTNIVEVGMIIRARLEVIKQTLEKSPRVLSNPKGASEWQQMTEIYANLKELCQEHHALSVRRNAAKLIRNIVVVTGDHSFASPTWAHTQWDALLSHLPGGLLYQPLRKVLVLGAAGVGKSTLVKQMKATKAKCNDATSYRDIIIGNVIASMKNILLDQKDLGGATPLDLSHSLLLMEAKQLILALPADWPPPLAHYEDEVHRAICTLWRDPTVRDFVHRAGGDLLPEAAPDSAEYFFKSMDRIFAPDYEPTHEDIIRSRVRTTGIHGHMVNWDSSTWHLIDVGGERGERKRWIQCFQNSTAVLFVVALSDYNKGILEDASVSRMQESLKLFDTLANSRWSMDTLIVLIFNKVDIFAEELNNSALKDWFPKYEGESYDDACNYMQKQFFDLVQEKNRPLVTHYICAVDTREISGTLQAIQDKISRHYEQQMVVL